MLLYSLNRLSSSTAPSVRFLLRFKKTLEWNLSKKDRVSLAHTVLKDAGIWDIIINPRRACAARVTVVACVCVCVCVCVCQLINISPLERLFVLKAIPRTQRTTKVTKFVAFCLKLLRCRDPALSTLVSIVRSAIFYSAEDVHAH